MVLGIGPGDTAETEREKMVNIREEGGVHFTLSSNVDTGPVVALREGERGREGERCKLARGRERIRNPRPSSRH